MSATARLHYDRVCWMPGHERAKRLPRQLALKPNLAVHRRPVNLENRLCQIHTNHRIDTHGCRPFRSYLEPKIRWHILTPSGRAATTPSHGSEPEDDACGERDGGEEGPGALVVMRSHPPPVLEATEPDHDPVAALVAPLVL